MASIEFVAVVSQVKTLADGGIRVTFDLPEDAVMQAAQLMECKRGNAVLEIKAVLQSFTNGKAKVDTGAKGSPADVGGGGLRGGPDY